SVGRGVSRSAFQKISPRKTSKMRDPDHYLPRSKIEKRASARPPQLQVAVERLPVGCLLYRLDGKTVRAAKPIEIHSQRREHGQLRGAEGVAPESRRGCARE